MVCNSSLVISNLFSHEKVSSQTGAAGLAWPERSRSGHFEGQGSYAKQMTVEALPSSRGRGTGFAGPQAQRRPRGAESYTKWANVGATSASDFVASTQHVDCYGTDDQQCAADNAEA